MVIIEHLAKRYGNVRAVNDLSFQVKPGAVTGFLGPNGAGKTTTLRMATHLIRPDAGRVTFDGVEYEHLTKPPRHVGLALEPIVFHPGRRAIDHLMMLAPYAGVGRKRCEQVLGLVGLDGVAHKRVGKFSLGMRGRLNLASALLGDPQTLLLDEPVNGLDPEGIRWIRELLRTLADQGRTILISSHLLSEVQQTVDNVVIIAHGELVYQGSLQALEDLGSSQIVVQTGEPDALRTLASENGWTITSDGPRTVKIQGATAAEVGSVAYTAGIPLEGLNSESTDLESIFFDLTQGHGRMR